MNLKSLSALGAGLLLAACSQAPRTDSLTQYVDMRIGTGGHGHVFMGANVPFGAVQLGPTSIPQSWDWTSGYHVSDTTVIGFSHTHLNGTGIGDLFDVTVMPVVGAGDLCPRHGGRPVVGHSGPMPTARGRSSGRATTRFR